MSEISYYRLRIAAAGLAVWAITTTASAQQYGQWTWDAQISARERSRELTESDTVVSELRDRDGFLSLGLNGFILHPVIAAFRLGISTSLLRHSGEASLDTRKLGYRGDLRIFPTGAYPVHLYLSRHDYTYTHDQTDSPATRIGSIPDEVTVFGARVRVRTGPLTGLVARAERSRISLIGTHGGVESHQYQFADWARSGKSWIHHLRLDRQARAFATGGYRTDDVTLLADEIYRSAGWELASSSELARRHFSSDVAAGSSMTAFRVQNRLLRTVSPTRSWDLQQSTGLTLASTSSQSHSLGARYSLSPTARLNIAPFASVSVQSSDAIRVFAPQAGLSATWTLGKGPFDALLSGSAASLSLDADGPAYSERRSAITASAGTSLSLRPRRGPHMQFDIYAARNQLRRSGEAIKDNSVLIPTGGVGTEDRTQARLTVGKRWRPVGLHFHVDWLAQSASGDLQVNPYSSGTLSSSLQVTLRNVNLSMSAANATLEQRGLQELEFLSAAARLRLASALSLSVSHRAEKRMVIGEPEVDGTRSEAGLSLRLGSYSIEPQAYMTTQKSGGPERLNRGFTLTVSRSFSGALPIVTGPQRRGVVR